MTKLRSYVVFDVFQTESLRSTLLSVVLRFRNEEVPFEQDTKPATEKQLSTSSPLGSPEEQFYSISERILPFAGEFQMKPSAVFKTQQVQNNVSFNISNLYRDLSLSEAANVNVTKLTTAIFLSCVRPAGPPCCTKMEKYMRAANVAQSARYSYSTSCSQESS